MWRHGWWWLAVPIFLALPAYGAQPPVLNFSDLTSGPKTGSTDTSLGQTSGQDGVIVTVWGTNLGAAQGSSKVFANGAEARVYTWGNATAPADLYSHLGMQMVSFQISHLAADGAGTIYVVVNGQASNTLPFTVRAGKIYFVKPTGSDTGGDGSWQKPWQTLANLNFNGALTHLLPGDTLYVCDGVSQTVEAGDRSVMDLDSDQARTGTAALPKALVGYPGAHTAIGNTAYRSTYSTFISGATNGYGAVNWTISKLTVTALNNVLDLNPGFRVVGNHVTAPNGSDASGAVEGSGDNLFVLGNEITHVGAYQCTKLYHPIYISGNRTSSGPRLPTESNREIAWNDLHDNYANDGINIYSEDSSSAYITNHRVHHNWVMNQTGRGMLIGSLITGENWFYNNVIVKAGLGPVSPEGYEGHYGVQISAGDRNYTTDQPLNTNTVIHFCNNTLYGCGWSGATDGANGAILFDGIDQYALDFANNVIVSTGDPYVAGWSQTPVAKGYRNLWFGAGSSPAWDTAAVNSDPLFVNAGATDFHLQAASPAIDRGLSSVAAFEKVDFNNLPRPQGSGFDLGAFEFLAGFTPPPPPPPPPPPNQPPTLTSGPAAAPNPAPSGQAIAFSAAASDDQGGALVYAWSFGDGATASGAAVSHAYAAPGTYTARVTVTDAGNLSASAALSVLVIEAGGGGGNNGGGSGGGGSSPGALTITQLQVTAKFNATGRDTASASGVLTGIPPGFNPAGQLVTLNLAGASVSFTLDVKGHGAAANGTFALKLKRVRDPQTHQLSFPGGDVPFTAHLKNGSWSRVWGMDPAQTLPPMPRSVPVLLDIGTLKFSSAVDVTYWSKAHTYGKFKK